MNLKNCWIVSLSGERAPRGELTIVFGVGMSKSDRASESVVSFQHQRIAPPITALGIARYAGLLAVGGAHEIVVTGTLPQGETTQNVTYFIVDRNTKTIVSQVILPDASNRFNAVEMRLTIGRSSGAYDVGSFDSNGEFKPSGFLSVRSSLNPSQPRGPSGG